MTRHKREIDIMRSTVVVASMLLIVLTGCDNGPTPPPPIPDAGSTIHINVTVWRGAMDDVTPEARKTGYIYRDSNISSLVNDFIRTHDVLTGQEVSFVWDHQIHEITVIDQNQHIWLPYGTWVDMFAHLGPPYYINEQLNLIFVPGIIDGSDPTAFMDTFTIDPAHNQDPHWETHDWKRMVLISDCWVWGNVAGVVEDMHPTRRTIPILKQMDHYILHHAIGRYLLRHTCDSPYWDCQENRVHDTQTYMHRWNDREHVGTWQSEILDRIQSGLWQAPDLP